MNRKNIFLYSVLIFRVLRILQAREEDVIDINHVPVPVGDELQKYLTPILAVLRILQAREEDVIDINHVPVPAGDELQKYLTLTCIYTRGSPDSPGPGGGRH